MSVVATGHRTHRPSAWAWLAQAWAGFRPRMGQETLALLTGLLVTVFFNTAFFRAAHATGALHGFGGLATGACLFVFVAALNTLLALLLFNRWSTRPVLALLLPVTAAAAFYMDHYGVYLDTDMVRNVLQTDARESTELLSFGLVAHVVLAGMLPAALAWRIELLRRRPARAMLVRAGAIVLAILVAAGAALLSFQSLSALMRNHHQIRHLITPGNYLVSLGRVLADEGTARDAPRKTLGAGAHVTDAQPDRRPRLLVLVVGETVRAQNWGLNGYTRQTTPQLSRMDLVNFSDVSSCGTATETSLPCMFSPFARTDYSKDKVRNSESLLHILDHAGVQVTWLDNQGGCKGVCSGLDFQSSAARTAAWTGSWSRRWPSGLTPARAMRWSCCTSWATTARSITSGIRTASANSSPPAKVPSWAIAAASRSSTPTTTASSTPTTCWPGRSTCSASRPAGTPPWSTCPTTASHWAKAGCTCTACRMRSHPMNRRRFR